MILDFEGKSPSLRDGVYLAPGSIVIGDAQIGEDVSIWFNTVIRADVHSVIIGDGSNVQDLSVIHVTENHPVRVGVGVTIGHKVIVHGAIVENYSLIGMGAVLLDGVVVGEKSLVAAGSVLPPGKTYPAGSLILGNPAKVVRPLKNEELQEYSNHYKSYICYKNKYLQQSLEKN